MERKSFPYKEHIAYIDRCARELIGQRPGLVYVDTKPDSPTHKFQYLVRVQRSNEQFVERLPVFLQLVERCLDANSDKELVELLDALLDQKFPE